VVAATVPGVSVQPTAASAAGWQPDPFRRHELRFNDGRLWTEHVSDRGIPGIDTVPVAELPRSRPPDRTAGTAGPPVAEAGAVRVVPPTSPVVTGVLDALLLVVGDAAVAERSRDGADQPVHDEHGVRVGTIRTPREPLVARALRMLTTSARRQVAAVDVFDAAGTLVLALDRPARFLKPRVTVRWGDGTEVGQIVPRRQFGGLVSSLEAGGVLVGTLWASSQDDRQLAVSDAQGQVVARVSTTWEVPSSSFHPMPDTHLVVVDRAMVDPLRSLAMAALLAADAMFTTPPSPAGRAAGSATGRP